MKQQPDERLERWTKRLSDEAFEQYWTPGASQSSAEEAIARAGMALADEELAELREALREVLAEFRNVTHPGQRCLQSDHVPVARVERWRSQALDGEQ